MSVFGCKITDAAMVRGCAPEQPATVEVGQEWMNATTGSVLPVKLIRGAYVDLGGDYYTVILTEAQLRAEYVCIDAPDNERSFAMPADERTAIALRVVVRFELPSTGERWNWPIEGEESVDAFLEILEEASIEYTTTDEAGNEFLWEREYGD